MSTITEEEYSKLLGLTEAPEKDRETVINEVAASLGKPVEWIRNVIDFESKGDTGATNPLSSAKGLIQFTNKTAQTMGYGSSQELTDKNPSFEAQMWNAVHPYLSKFDSKNEDDFYLSVFHPASMGSDLDREFSSNIQKSNPGIRTPRDYVNKVKGIKPGQQPVTELSDADYTSLLELTEPEPTVAALPAAQEPPVIESAVQPLIEPAVTSTTGYEQPEPETLYKQTPEEIFTGAETRAISPQAVLDPDTLKVPALQGELIETPGIQPVKAVIEGTKALARMPISALKSINEADKAQNQEAVISLEMAIANAVEVGDNTMAKFYRQKLDRVKNLLDVSSKAVDVTKALVESGVLKPKDIAKAPGIKGWIQDAIRLGPQVLVQGGVHMLAGGIGSMAFMVTQIAGGTAEKLEQEGVDPETILIASLGNAAAQAPLEAIGMGRALQMWQPGKAGKAILKEIIEAGGTEFITEAMQEVPDAVSEIWAKNKDKSLSQQFGLFVKDFWNITKQALYSGSLGALMGAGTAGAKISITEGVARTKLQQELEVRTEADRIKLQEQRKQIAEGEPAAITPTRVKETAAQPELTEVEEEAAERRKGERRVEVEKRKTIDEMSPEEKTEALSVDEKTGLGTERAWNDKPREPAQGIADLDGLKWTNDTYGYASGDVLLKAYADSFKEAGIEGYRGGKASDEIFFEGKDQKTIDKQVEKAYTILQGKTINVVRLDGTKESWKGAGFSYGTAENKNSENAQRDATTRLHESKIKREKAGLRGKRAEEPPGISSEPTSRDQDRQRDVEGLPSPDVIEAKQPPLPAPEIVKQKPPKPTVVEPVAHEVGEEPSIPQAMAGNYPKEHQRRDGMEISIESAAGSIRKDKTGKKDWAQKMHHDYGYIRGTKGADYDKNEDQVDAFVNPGSKEGGNVFVINQNDAQGNFDEHKVMMGFDTKEEAEKAYLSNYEEGWTGLGSTAEMTMDDFKTWVFDGVKREPAPVVTVKAPPEGLTEDEITLVKDVAPESDEYYETLGTARYHDSDEIISKSIAKEYGKDIAGKYGGKEARGVVFKKGQVSGRAEMRLQQAQKNATLKDLRDAALGYLNSKNIPTKTRGGLLVRLKDAVTPGKMKQFYKAVDALENKLEHDQAVDNLKKVFKSIPAQMRPEYKARIEELAVAVDLTKMSESKTEFLNELRDMAKLFPEAEFSKKVQQDLDRLDKTSVKDMEPGEIEDIANELKRLISNQKLKNKLYRRGKWREHDKAVTQAETNIASWNERKKLADYSDKSSDTKDISRIQKILSSVVGAEAENVETIIEKLEGLDIDDPKAAINQTIFGGADEAETTYDRNYQKFEDDFKEFAEGIDIEKMSPFMGGNKKDVFVDIEMPDGSTITMTKAQRIGLYNSSKNEHNMKNLLSNPITFDNARGKRKFELTAEEVSTIIKSMPADEIKVADYMFEMVNTVTKELINSTSVDLNGYELATEENYWRLVRDETYQNYLTSDSRPADLVAYLNATIEGHGSFKARKRTARGTVVIEDAFRSFYDTIKLASAYNAYAKYLRSSKQLLNDLQGTFKEHGLNQQYHILKRFISDIEGNNLVSIDVEMGKILARGISHLYRGALGNNPVVILRQIFSYPVASQEIDIQYLLKGFVDKTPTAEVKKEIWGYSPQLRARFQGQQVNIELGAGAITREMSRFFIGNRVWYKNLDTQTQGIRWTDSKTIMSVWQSAKFQIDGTTDLKDEERMKAVAHLAEKAVRRTQPTYSTKDRPAVARTRNPLIRLATAFTSVTSKMLQVYKRSYQKALRTGKRAKSENTELQQQLLTANEDQAKIINMQIGKNNAEKTAANLKFIQTVAITWLSSSMAMAGIDDLFDKIFNRRTENLKVAQRIARYTLSPIYFSGPFVAALFDVLKSVKEGRRTSYNTDFAVDNILYSSVKSLIKAISDIGIGFIPDDIGEVDMKKISKGLINFTDQAAKIFAGVAFKNLIKYTMDLPKITLDKLSETESVKLIKKKLPDQRFPPSVSKVKVYGKSVYPTTVEKEQYVKDVYANIEKYFKKFQSEYDSAKTVEKKTAILDAVYKASRAEALGKMKESILTRLPEE